MYSLGTAEEIWLRYALHKSGFEKNKTKTKVRKSFQSN